MKTTLDRLLDEILHATGLDLRGYRRPTLERRFAARMAKLGVEDPSEYMNLFLTDKVECVRLVDSLVVKVSSFFRDPIVFEILAQSVLPSIIQRKSRGQTQSLRVWCAGCATGEEAYSIAAVICDALKDDLARWGCFIFATDVSESALATARKGVYPREQLEQTKLGTIDRHFIVRDAGYEVAPSLKNMIRFSYDDLLSQERMAPVDSIFGTFDLVLCRNVLIYLDDDWQDRVLYKLYKSLSLEGYLVLGSSECLSEGLKPVFHTLDHHNRIFVKRS